MIENENDLSFEKRDEFRRKPIAQNLIKIIGADVPISTIVIDGPWGSGKTEFCQKFLNLSKADKAPFTCVYIDAFKYDHAVDPLAMLISAIASVVPDTDQKNDILKKAIPVVKVLGKAAGKVAIGLVLQTNAEKLGDQITDAIADSSEEALDEGIKKVLENYEQAEETLKIFKEALGRSASKKKIVVIVDELDRCRPDFSLSILEKIKHVFDVKNVCFVLSTNVKQLEAVVKKQYGSDLDAENYLSKFFSYTLHLPQDHSHNSYDYNQNSFQLFASLVQTNSNLKCHFGERSSISGLLKEIFERDRRSLRDAEMFYRNMTILNTLSSEYSIKENTVWGYVAFLALGTYIYTFHSHLSQHILDERVSIKEFEELLGVTFEELSQGPSHSLEGTIFAAIALDINKELFLKSVGEEKTKEWSREIYQIFSHGHDPGQGNRLAVIDRALRILQMR